MARPDTQATGRISVVRGRRLVPLLGSAAGGAGAAQPWAGVLLERHTVTRGEIPEHEHPELCLHVQMTGSEDFEWWSEGKNAVERTRPGSLILIPPGTRDRLRWSGRSERLIVSVRQERLARAAESLGARGAVEFRADWALGDASLANLVTEMSREAQGGWPLGGLYADLLALGLETQLLRRHAATALAAQAVKGGLGLAKLRRAMEYIHANLAEEVRLEAVAAELGMSASHFAHEFRGSTGQTPYQYLLDLRMEKAKALLKGTGWPVQTIAGLVGFGSAVNFVRAFRQRVGTTPGEWRVG